MAIKQQLLHAAVHANPNGGSRTVFMPFMVMLFVGSVLLVPLLQVGEFHENPKAHIALELFVELFCSACLDQSTLHLRHAHLAWVQGYQLSSRRY